MVYWVEYEKASGIRERAGRTLIEARRNAYFILSGGRYGNEAYIYNGQKWVGTCHYSKSGSYYETVFGKKLRLHENGLTSEFKKKSKEWHPFGL